MADSTGLGCAGGARFRFRARDHCRGLWVDVSRTVLFWIAFVPTGPLGATVGDFLDKPFDHGGLAPSRYTASATLAATMVHLIVPLPQRAEQHSA
jgi:uncharacterized membrane-anchored protein